MVIDALPFSFKSYFLSALWKMDLGPLNNFPSLPAPTLPQQRVLILVWLGRFLQDTVASAHSFSSTRLLQAAVSIWFPGQWTAAPLSKAPGQSCGGVPQGIISPWSAFPSTLLCRFPAISISGHHSSFSALQCITAIQWLYLSPSWGDSVLVTLVHPWR